MKHGGKREGAGRPATGRKETIVVRIDAGLLQAVNDLKNGVTTNQTTAIIDSPASYDAQFSANSEISRLQGAVDELEQERVAIKKQLKAGSGDREAKQALQKERDALIAQVKELERVAALDAGILDDVKAERDKLLHGNKQRLKPA